MFFSCLIFRTPGMVKQFIADLHSGKLHREFHHGPDPMEQPKIAAGQVKHLEKESLFIVVDSLSTMLDKQMPSCFEIQKQIILDFTNFLNLCFHNY